MSDSAQCKNTDRELWRGPDEGNGSYYADSIHVTEGGGIGINVGGRVIVMPLRAWHTLAFRNQPAFPILGPACAACEQQPSPDCDNPACAFKGYVP